MIFSDMLVKTLNETPEEGELKGECCICGKTTDKGFKKKFGGNFTSAEYVSSGDVICPECHYLVKHSNEYRRTMFLLTEEELVKFKKKEAKEIIFNLPNKPFFIYLTKTWQKIGWIRMNDVFNKDNQGIINFLVDYDIIRCTLEELKDKCAAIEILRDLKIPKTVIESGELEMHHYRRISEKYNVFAARDFVILLKNNKGSPVWDLALFLED